MGVFAAGLLYAPQAWAGVDECGGMRVEGAAWCQVVVSASCEAQCGVGIYKTACATELRTECNPECTAPPETECTTDCGEICEADCSNGVSMVCVHNCFDECIGSCSDACIDADDPEQCRASCESTCNGECDDRCAIVNPDDSCMKHCLECCSGSCTAIANMDCQISCQQQEFERCEYRLGTNCEAGCQADGSLFCDGEFVMSGWGIQDCAEELARRGVAVSVRVDLPSWDDVSVDVEWDSDDDSGSLCRIGEGRGGLLFASLLGLGLFGLRRRRGA